MKTKLTLNIDDKIVARAKRGELGNVKGFSFQFPSLPVISPTNFIKEIYLNDLS